MKKGIWALTKRHQKKPYYNFLSYEFNTQNSQFKDNLSTTIQYELPLSQMQFLTYSNHTLCDKV